MRKSLLKAVAATAIVGTSMLICNVASVFAWTVPDDMATISESKAISIDEEVAGTGGEWSTTKLSINKYIKGEGSVDLGANNAITVGTTKYTNTLKVKQLASRAIAIKVSGKCQIDVYTNCKNDRNISMGYATDGDSANATVLETKTTAKESNKYNVATATYTGDESATIFIYASNDLYISLIDVSFVEDVNATAIDIAESEVDILIDEEYALDVSLTPSDANSETTWESNNEAVATVAGGIITGVAEGTATITATNNEHTDTVTVNVSKQGAVSDLSPITPGTYTFTDEQTRTIAKGKLLFENKALAVDKLSYAKETTYAVGDSENKIDGFFLKKGGNGEVAVLLPNNSKITTVVYVSSQSEPV